MEIKEARAKELAEECRKAVKKGIKGGSQCSDILRETAGMCDTVAEAAICSYIIGRTVQFIHMMMGIRGYTEKDMHRMMDMVDRLEFEF